MHNSKGKHICLLATGGTIAGVSGPAGGYEAGVRNIHQVLALNGFTQQDPNLEAVDLCTVAGQQHTPETWALIGSAVRQKLAAPNIDGVVVLTGTDTLEELAYFLSLTIASHKPVVVTGSMYPSDAPGSDASDNLRDAIEVARNPEIPGGATVVLDSRIFASRGITKTSTRFPGAFGAPIEQHSHLLLGGQVLAAAGRRKGRNSEFHNLPLMRLPQVDVLYGYAGNSAHLARAAVQAGAQGIVVAGVGSGNMNEQLEQELREISHTGKAIVVRASRILGGVVLPGSEFGADDPFVSAGDLHPAQARVLLTLSLAAGLDRAGVARAFAEY